MCCWVLSTRHDAITQLYHLRHLNDSLRVITLVRQQDKEVENVRNQQTGIADITNNRKYSYLDSEEEQTNLKILEGALLT